MIIELGKASVQTRTCVPVFDTPPPDSASPKRQYYLHSASGKFCYRDVDGASSAWVQTSLCPLANGSDYDCTP